MFPEYRHTNEELRKNCKMIAWSIKKDGKQRLPVCPQCGAEAEVALFITGEPAYFHKINRS